MYTRVKVASRIPFMRASKGADNSRMEQLFLFQLPSFPAAHSAIPFRASVPAFEPPKYQIVVFGFT